MLHRELNGHSATIILNQDTVLMALQHVCMYTLRRTDEWIDIGSSIFISVSGKASIMYTVMSSISM